MCAFVEHFVGQWNVAGDDQVAGLTSLHDFLIGNVKARGHLNTGDVFGAGNLDPLVGDQGHVGLCSVGGAKDDFFDHHRTGVCIDPYFHVLPHFAEVGFAHAGVSNEVAGFAFEVDKAGVHDVGTVGNFEGDVGILFDQ